MSLSLYDATIPQYLQILGALRGLLDKASAFAAAQDTPESVVICARIHETMLDFAYQVKSAVVHSVGAVEGVKVGQFSPNMDTPPDSFAALKTFVDDGLSKLASYTPEEVNALEDADMRFTIGDKLAWDFTGAKFLLSFSTPNFYFHVTTAYGILRSLGVDIGKRDYLGALQMRS